MVCKKKFPHYPRIKSSIFLKLYLISLFNLKNLISLYIFLSSVDEDILHTV